jgi:hypothetical protein
MCKSSKKSLSSIKNKITSILGSSKHKIMKFGKNTLSKMRKTLKQSGGTYNQYQGNIPNTPSYSTGGHLSLSMSALANPVPYKPVNSCIDNYNHNTTKGFQFW